MLCLYLIHLQNINTIYLCNIQSYYGILIISLDDLGYYKRSYQTRQPTLEGFTAIQIITLHTAAYTIIFLHAQS